MRYVPLDTIDHCDATAEPSGRRVSCPDCDKRYQQGAVITDKPVWHEGVSGYVVKRVAYCDHCRQLFEWLENWMNGKPRGVVIGKAKPIADRRRIDLFLDEHPEAAGVIQV